MKKLLFKEEQEFDRRRLLLLTIVSLAATGIPFFRGIYFLMAENPPGDNPMGSEGLIVSGVMLLVVAVIFTMLFRAKLKTKITVDTLSISFPPMKGKWRDIDPGEIERYELREYHPKREYGGRGIKRRLRKGSAWTVSGRIGLQLYMKNGKRFLIGTQKQQALEHAMQKLMEKEE
ncbi:hypothetical protein SLH46_08630 [Draconibacterium sp. IB214405]|uniref:hypothetical protein n=1 Tax=Draconibacterium sp. IB214405 TaxID=3097352 RepID=UPI002A10D778|nr:hypothetical protein [Draconibacterium sp. IB214405]MDX8339242.1 hypothetical protein [Draconibacterium sp. IB214405]